MNENTILKIEDVSVIYENGKGISNFNLNFDKGDFVALVGSNGAGKSTLINAISGIQKLNNGRIEFNDKYITSKYPYNILGFSPQSQVIDWYLTVADNVKLGLLLAGKKTKEVQSMVDEALDIVNLKGKQDLSVDQLSGGQQQRVQIARAIAHNPYFYLLDEPTTGLDAESSEKFLRYLKSKTENEECAVLLSSHDLTLLENYCKKMIYIDQGEIVYFGNIKDFVNNNSNRKRYIVEYNGELDSEVLNELKVIAKDVVMIDENNNLVLDLDLDVNVSSLISIIEKNVKLINIKNENISLRDTYLNMKGRR
ncbi:ABC transporter ATP-binding protein [Amphibacillus indicireducens]|uniref:ABC transporter ATP-binding protein n=1 Tax=Amphibacillus indicireducens TaxID=1076330 RepID=A0ABP7VTC8_9BACI